MKVKVNKVNSEAKGFYDGQYNEKWYAPATKMQNHPFYAELKDFIFKYKLEAARALEVGSGRGALQDIVENYTGLDYSDSVKENYHKPFVSSSACKMPFKDNEFDFLWSYAVLEHIYELEETLNEMIRVTKGGGIILLHPAWQCPKWLANGYKVRPYSDFSFLGKIYKASIPFRENKTVFKIQLLFKRLAWLISYRFFSSEKLYYQRLNPNYKTYWQSDSDACNNIDQFATALWFERRGHIVTPATKKIRTLRYMNYNLIIQVKK